MNVMKILKSFNWLAVLAVLMACVSIDQLAVNTDMRLAFRVLLWADLLSLVVCSCYALLRPASAASPLGELDAVRVTRDTKSDGYTLKKGMTGTVVSVYTRYNPYTVKYGVEISAIADGPVVATLQADEIERIWISCL